MQILMLSERPYPDHGGGAGKFAHLLAACLVRRGHVVHLLCYGPGGSSPYSMDGIQVHRVPFLPCEGIAPQDIEYFAMDSLLAYIRANIPMASIDLVHDTCGFLSFWFPLSQHLQRLYSVPVVTHFGLLQFQLALTVFGPYPYSRAFLAVEGSRYETPQCFAVRISDRIVCPSRADAEFVQALYCPPPGCVVALHNPVEMFDLSSESIAATRNKLAKPGEWLIFFGGRTASHEKNSRTVLSAIRRLRIKHPEARLVLATDDKEEVERYHRGLGEAVTSLGWIRDAKEMARILAAVDAVVMPSLYESYGQMAAEAMSVGTPVVASPVGAMVELIRNGENGFILGMDSRQWDREIEERLVTLLKDRDLCRRMGLQGRRTVEEKISVDRVTAQMEKLYRELVEIPHSNHRFRPGLPVLSTEKRDLYLQTLMRLGKETARRVGEDVLARWPVTGEQRCLKCSHHRIATDTRNLVRLQRARFWTWLPWRPSWSEAVQHAVASQCPLALLQKEELRIRGSSSNSLS